MNKLQRAVCKIFKIEQQIISINENDPTKMLSYGIVSKDRLSSFMTTIVKNIRGSDSIEVGYEDSALEIRSVPLSSNLANSLSMTEIVIRIKQTKYEDEQ